MFGEVKLREKLWQPWMRRWQVAGVGAALWFGAVGIGAAQSAAGSLHAQFLNPPDASKPMMRWWWFGPAAVNAELKRELDEMQRAGIGGVEIASEYPLSLDDPAKGIVNQKYLSAEYLKTVQFAADYASSLGMRVDLTLGSGWPFGGPHIPIDLAAARLKTVVVPLGSSMATLPHLQAGEKFITAFVADGTAQHYDAAKARRVEGTTMPVALATPKGDQVEIFFLSSHTKQAVKRASYGAEGYVLDHMSRPAVDRHLHAVGDVLLTAFPKQQPYAIFSDSLEAYGSDWTPELPQEFLKRRGYDLVARLPELVQGGTPEADALRHDWGLTMAELVRENYLEPITQYASTHGTRFRSQTYGEPAVRLSDEKIPQLAEGEGPQWRSFSFTRWATSANHLYGHPVTSAETWTWLDAPVFRATPLDMKEEADKIFLEGVNQLIGHGFPYSAPGVQEPGWSLYAAAALNDHNPWWPVMPYVTKYLQRVSWALRQGEPANDVLVLLPEDDAQADFHPGGHVSITEQMRRRITPELMSAILDSGYNLDYTDVESLRDNPVKQKILVVPAMHRLPLEGVHALQAYASRGGKIVFLGELPTLSGGLSDARDAAAVRDGLASLAKTSVRVSHEAGLGKALQGLLPPDVTVQGAEGKVGFIHRALKDKDIYFFVNTSATPVEFAAQVRAKRKSVEWWDADTGAATEAMLGQKTTFAAYESRLLVLSDDAVASDVGVGRTGASAERAKAAASSIQLKNWSMQFVGSALSRKLPSRQSVEAEFWTKDATDRTYSGEVRYTTKFRVKSDKSERVILRFADSKALPEPPPTTKPGTRAWLEAPIRDAAIVMVNGKQAGAVWHPPYELDVTEMVQKGVNALEVRVFNTAMNAMSAQPARDYSALIAKYGDRFQMQEMDKISVQPSGIEGPVWIEYRKDERQGRTQ